MKKKSLRVAQLFICVILNKKIPCYLKEDLGYNRSVMPLYAPGVLALH